MCAARSPWAPSAWAIVGMTALGSRTVARPTQKTPFRNSPTSSGGGLDRQARLARAARAGQRHQPRPREQRLDLVDLALAPDEARRRPGQVRVRDRLQRRERLLAELEEPDRLGRSPSAGARRDRVRVDRRAARASPSKAAPARRGRTRRSARPRWTSSPTYPSSGPRAACRCASPIRTRTDPGSSAACASTAAATAPAASGRRRRTRRPACPPRRRRARANASRITRRCSASASA